MIEKGRFTKETCSPQTRRNIKDRILLLHRNSRFPQLFASSDWVSVRRVRQCTLAYTKSTLPSPMTAVRCVQRRGGALDAVEDVIEIWVGRELLRAHAEVQREREPARALLRLHR